MNPHRISILLLLLSLTIPAGLSAKPDEAQNKDAANLALIEAARSSSLPGVQSALTSGANIDYADESGATALMYMVNHNNLEATSFLLQKRASVNLRDARGYSALSIAAGFKGNPAMVELLLKNKADANVTWQESRSLLIQIVASLPLKELYQDKSEYNSALIIVKLLIQAGADVHARDQGPVYQGYSILMYAARMNSSQIVQLLLQKKVDVNLKAADGKSALRCAEESHSEANIKLLTAAGAKSE